MVKCENCGTENGYPKFREMIWICRKCLHKTKIKIGGDEEDADKK